MDDDLTIEGLGSQAEGIGSLDGLKVFVPVALPGERVRVRVTQRRKTYAKGKLLSVLQPSPHRVEPPCPVYDRCGGCQIMHLAYPEQLRVKQQQVIDALQRIGHLSHTVLPCVASPSPLGYRNKIQLPIIYGASGVKIGLYASSTHQIVPIEKCAIHCPLGEEVLGAITPLIKGSDPGLLRHLVLRTATDTRQVLVLLVTRERVSKKVEALASRINRAHPAIRSVFQNINPHGRNVILGPTWRRLEGSEHIEETLLGLTLRLSPASFFQINHAQAEQLYTKAIELADLGRADTVLDLYCGIGSLSLLAAQRAKQVIGIEAVRSAIDNAIQNAQLNQLHNCDFHWGLCEEMIAKAPSADVAFLNPPRKGCEETVLQALARAQVNRLVYISCNPATLARDLRRLTDLGYTLQTVQPFDMFPQTAHVEVIAHLTRS